MERESCCIALLFTMTFKTALAWGFDATEAPAVCKGFATALERQLSPPGAAFDPARSVEDLPGGCRAAIDAGQWPELNEQLVASPRSEPHELLCRLMPPNALSDIERRLLRGPADSSDDFCAVVLLRQSTSGFARVTQARLMPTAQDGWAVPPLALSIALMLRPEELEVLFPVLEEANRHRSRGRDRLYETICAAGRTTKGACRRDLQREQEREPLEPETGRAPVFATNVAFAMTYAALCIWIRSLYGDKGMSWGWAGFGATAATISFALVTAGPTFEARAYALVLSPVAVVVVLGLTYLGIRLGVRVIAACLLAAAVYVGTAIIHWRGG